MQITPEQSERILDLLGEAAGFETLFNRSDPSPWTGVELRDGQAVQNAVDLASRLNYEVIPALRRTSIGCPNRQDCCSQRRWHRSTIF